MGLFGKNKKTEGPESVSTPPATAEPAGETAAVDVGTPAVEAEPKDESTDLLDGVDLDAQQPEDEEEAEAPTGSGDDDGLGGFESLFEEEESAINPSFLRLVDLMEDVHAEGLQADLEELMDLIEQEAGF